MRLDRRTVVEQGIGDAVQAHHAHALEVHLQQLAQRRALAQPAPRGALRARPGQARDDGGHGERALRAVEAQPLQQGLQPELLHRPSPDLLDAHRAWADQLQRADVHRPQIAAPGRGGCRASEELRRDALGMPLHLFRTGRRHQLALAVEQLLDAGAQDRPVPSLDREVAPQIEKGTLADPVAAALRAHQAMREIDLAASTGAGPGAPDEHEAQNSGGRKRQEQPNQNIMALHRNPAKPDTTKSTTCGRADPPSPTNQPTKR